MSLDHNRIKVADLEKDLPNKILITNADGELEFSDAAVLDGNFVTLDTEQTITSEKRFTQDILFRGIDSENRVVIDGGGISFQENGHGSVKLELGYPENDSEDVIQKLQVKNGTIALTDDITLQKIIDNGANADVDEGHSNLSFFSGTEDERNIYLVVGNGSEESQYFQNKNNIVLEANKSDNNSLLSISASEGVNIFYRDLDNSTTFNLGEPTSTSTFSLPSKSIDGNYILATADDLEDNFVHRTGEVNEYINGNKQFTGETSFGKVTVDSGSDIGMEIYDRSYGSTALFVENYDHYGIHVHSYPDYDQTSRPLTLSTFGSVNFEVDQEGNTTAQSFIKSGGTSSQFLKADGSVDSNTYGDMSTNTNQTVSGIKTFLSGMLGLRNIANTFTSFFTNTNTASRTYTLQDRNGTLADLTDIAGRMAVPSGTTNVVPKFLTSSTIGNSSIQDSGSLVTVTNATKFIGLNTIQGTTASDGAQLGAELITTGTSDSSWTGTSFSTGYTHVPGSVTTLTNSFAPTNNSYYQLAYTVTGRTAGSFSLVFGGNSLNITASNTQGIKTSSTGSLVITPTSVFDGTITISIKLITASIPMITYQNSLGTVVNEFRSGSVSNIAIGLNAGQRFTTGNFNTIYGQNAGQSGTTLAASTIIGNSAGSNIIEGYDVTAVGRTALANLTYGARQTAIGTGSLSSLVSGGLNSALGAYSLSTITSGGSNVAIGQLCGFFLSTTGNPSIVNNSVLIGDSVKVFADNSNNEIIIGQAAIGIGNNSTVIGNASTVRTNLKGRLLLGTTTDDGTNQLQVNGSAIATAWKVVGGSSSQFLKADGSVDSNTYATTASLSSGYVTLGTTQTITGAKNFTGPVNMTQASGNIALIAATGNNNAIFSENNSENPTIYVHNAHATGQGIQIDADGQALVINSNGNYDTASIYNGGGGKGLSVVVTENTAASFQNSTGTALEVNSTAGSGIQIYSFYEGLFVHSTDSNAAVFRVEDTNTGDILIVGKDSADRFVIDNEGRTTITAEEEALVITSANNNAVIITANNGNPLTVNSTGYDAITGFSGTSTGVSGSSTDSIGGTFHSENSTGLDASSHYGKGATITATGDTALTVTALGTNDTVELYSKIGARALYTVGEEGNYNLYDNGHIYIESTATGYEGHVNILDSGVGFDVTTSNGYNKVLNGSTGFELSTSNGDCSILDTSTGFHLNNATGNLNLLDGGGALDISTSNGYVSILNGADCDIRMTDGGVTYSNGFLGNIDEVALEASAVGSTNARISVNKNGNIELSSSGNDTTAAIVIDTDSNIQLNTDATASRKVYYNGNEIATTNQLTLQNVVAGGQTATTALGYLRLLDGTDSAIRSTDGTSYDNKIEIEVSQIRIASYDLSGSDNAEVKTTIDGNVELNTNGGIATYNGYEIKTVDTTPSFYTSATTSALTSATLTSTYPYANIGSEVHALSIVGGGVIYKKTATGWATILATVTP